MFFLDNCMFSLFIHRCEWGIKVSHYYCVIVNFPFHTCQHLSYILCGAPMLGAYIFIIVISSSWIDPLIIIQCPLSLFTAFVLKSLLCYEYCYSAFFWSLFAWNIFFQPFTFSLYVSPVLMWVSCRQHIQRSCFCIHSASFVLWSGHSTHLCLR